jgi:hypothetical protein
MSSTIRHIATTLCTKYDLDLFFNESDIVDCDIILIDDGANGMNYDKYKTPNNRVVFMTTLKNNSLENVKKCVDEIITKPFLPSDLSNLILELERQISPKHREQRANRIHHNFLVDGTLMHNQKEKAHNKKELQQQKLDQQLKAEQNIKLQAKQQQINQKKNTQKSSPFDTQSNKKTPLVKEIANSKGLNLPNDVKVGDMNFSSFNELEPTKYGDGNINIAFNRKDDVLYDTSLVNSADVNSGGILDSNEILKVKRMLNETSGKKEIIGELSSLVIESSNDEWASISEIVDDSIKEYSFEITEPMRLMLNAYSLQELEPFFEKLDGEAVQALIDGEEISLDVKMQNI